jgi:hypothetical protein
MARLDTLLEQRRQKRVNAIKTLLNSAGNRPQDLLGASGAKLCRDFLEVMKERNYQFAQTIQADKDYWRRVIEHAGLSKPEERRGLFGVKIIPVEWSWPQPRQGYDIGVYSYDDGSEHVEKWASRIYLCTDGMVRNSSAGSLPPGSDISHLMWRTKITSNDSIYGSTGYPEPYEISLEDMLFSRMQGNTSGDKYT